MHVRPSFLYGFRARTLGFGLVAIGEAVVFPGRAHGFAGFMQTPGGLAIDALIVTMVGSFVEEMGGLARIRTGNVVRLASAALAVASMGWALVSSKSVGAGWIFTGSGAVIIGLAARFDAARLRDTRTGEVVRLDDAGDAALTLSVEGRSLVLPLRAVSGVSVVKHQGGRGVAIAVSDRKAIDGAADSLPWVVATRDADVFFLSEHQCNLDAAELAGRLRERLALPRDRYR